MMNMGNYAIDHNKMLPAIELFVTKVAPLLCKKITARNQNIIGTN